MAERKPRQPRNTESKPTRSRQKPKKEAVANPEVRLGELHLFDAAAGFPDAGERLLDGVVVFQPQHVSRRGAAVLQRAQLCGEVARKTQPEKKMVHAPEQIGRGIERDDPSLLEHRDPLAQRLGFLQVMRREHDRVPVPVESADKLP